MRLSAYAFLLMGHLAIVAGVVSPFDKVTQDMKAMKETLDSIQASLITSVSLIQGETTKCYRPSCFPHLSRNCHADFGLAIMWRGGGRKGKLAKVGPALQFLDVPLSAPHFTLACHH